MRDPANPDLQHVAQAIRDVLEDLTISYFTDHPSPYVVLSREQGKVFVGLAKECYNYIDTVCAKAAVTAMRDPSEAVIAAVEAKAEERYHAAPAMQRWYGDDVWNAGIDAVLGEASDA